METRDSSQCAVVASASARSAAVWLFNSHCEHDLIAGWKVPAAAARASLDDEESKPRKSRFLSRHFPRDLQVRQS